MSKCEVTNCGYWYADEGEMYPRCHFEGPDGLAPCEQEEEDRYNTHADLERSRW